MNSPLSEGAKRPPEEEKTHLSSRFFLFPLLLSLSRIKKKNSAGVKYGTLMSANNLAQLVASYFWGWASDATGRKPLLLLSNVVSGAASAWFVSTRTFG